MESKKKDSLGPPPLKDPLFEYEEDEGDGNARVAVPGGCAPTIKDMRRDCARKEGGGEAVNSWQETKSVRKRQTIARGLRTFTKLLTGV